MEIYKTKRIESEVLEDVVCDACGKSCETKIGGFEYAMLSATWSWGSRKNGEIHDACICEKCYDKIVEAFNIQPTRYTYGGKELTRGRERGSPQEKAS